MREKIIKFFSFFKRKTNNEIPPDVPKNVMDAAKEVAYFTTFYGFFLQTSNIIKTLKHGYYTLGRTIDEKLLDDVKSGFDDLIRLTTDDKIKMLLQQTRDEVINSLKNHDFDNAEKAIKTLLEEVDDNDDDS
ncbi:MAG: hypothetical protein RXR18_06785 [Nitrososphaeria archaeon]